MRVREIKVSYSLPNKKKIIIHNSEELYQVAISHWSMDTIELQEEVKAIFLNRSNCVIGIYELSKGGISSSIIDIKLLMSVALKCLTSSIALVHNHPSGNLNPSEADNNITYKIKKACNYLEIKFLDHLIISKYGYFSYSDRGLI